MRWIIPFLLAIMLIVACTPQSPKQPSEPQIIEAEDVLEGDLIGGDELVDDSALEEADDSTYVEPSEEQEDTPEKKPEEVEEAKTQGPTVHIVQIERLEFNPPILEIKAGDVVMWNNTQNRRAVIRDTKRLFHEFLDPLDTFNFTFENPGTVEYRDLRVSLSGKIIVSE